LSLFMFWRTVSRLYGYRHESPLKKEMMGKYKVEMRGKEIGIECWKSNVGERVGAREQARGRTGYMEEGRCVPVLYHPQASRVVVRNMIPTRWRARRLKGARDCVTF
jgi:hypothetical protein